MDLPTALSNIQSKLDESHASGVKVERGDLEVVVRAARELSHTFTALAFEAGEHQPRS